MKIVIKGESPSSYDTADMDIILDDEGFNNNEWVNLSVDGRKTEVMIDDLMPALIAFDAKRSRNKPDNL